MANLAKIIAAAGALTGGYLKGQEIRRERDWQDEEREQKRKQWAAQQRIRDALDGTAGADATGGVGPTDFADMGAFSGGGTTPRSAETIQRVGTNVTRDPAFAQQMADTENFASGADEGQAAKVSPQAAAVSGGTGLPSTSNVAEAYRRNKVPQVIDAYLRAGDIQGAKTYRDFVDSEQGRAYTTEWAAGVRRLTIGDHQGALSHFEKLYNSPSFDDGQRVKLTDLGDGKVKGEVFGADGAVVGSKEFPIDQLSRQAGIWLAPEKAAELAAKTEAARAAEAATLGRQVQIEGMRQEGQDARDDRRDKRTQLQIDAADARLERRLAADAGRGGLTVQQQRQNAEIDAARETVAGMTPQEIMRRTAKATNTGRENPDYDPGLARQAALANRRKIGDDPEFDGRAGGQPSATAQPGAVGKQAGTPIERAMAALANDSAMAGYSLGEQTARGFKVLDKDGRHVGYYGQAR